ncbi:hypothetical protein LOK49_LG09G00151 [Camellia lanceoleosa]|uniref:Uncharacterized protein n=1 Tax=Camellia lanceoleosa TaxID=1840588 RepID=A0ACC0GH62_9ERIC|nr:hypothetical protein LOK49_LG09G00151 [Camellia lanceoleosa]
MPLIRHSGFLRVWEQPGQEYEKPFQSLYIQPSFESISWLWIHLVVIPLLGQCHINNNLMHFHPKRYRFTFQRKRRRRRRIQEEEEEEELTRYSGPTIHFVDEHYDTGRILAQRVVPVLANDTAHELAARVLEKVLSCYCSCFALVFLSLPSSKLVFLHLLANLTLGQ